jgi:hypothetical protein
MLITQTFLLHRPENRLELVLKHSGLGVIYLEMMGEGETAQILRIE